MIERVESNNKKLFGLLGRNISYSFSSGYFKEKFGDLQLENHQYVNFDIQSIDEFQALINKNKNELSGMNVTIPYKQEVINCLNEIDNEALEIGAVNTIKFTSEGKLKVDKYTSQYKTIYKGHICMIRKLT